MVKITMINICFVFGTRPEYLKLIEVIKIFKKNKKFKVIVLYSNQQKILVKKYIKKNFIDFEMELNDFKNDSIFISKFFLKINRFYKKSTIDYFFVQGDTNTAYATSLFSFYQKIPLIHLEAGLRTHDIYNPFPEEFIRQSISKIALIHLVQNQTSKDNLIKEGILKNIFIVGNPGIDNLVRNLGKLEPQKVKKKSILITLHRRENFGENAQGFINNLKNFLKSRKEYKVFWPLHSNPIILNQIKRGFESYAKNQIRFFDPLNYKDFLKLICISEFIITDSGGVQEEAAYLGKPLLIARDKTEREDILNLEIGEIIHANGSKLESRIDYFNNNKIKKSRTNLWKKNQGLGQSAIRIYRLLKTLLNNFESK